MANKMAEFRGKLAIFWQKAASLSEAARGGGSPENLKTQGGILAIPSPLAIPVLYAYVCYIHLLSVYRINYSE